MIAKVWGACKSAWYKVLYGKHIRFEGIPSFEGTARINLKKGKGGAGRNFHMKTNSYIAIIDGGTVEIGQSVSLARNSIIVCHDKIVIGDHCAIAPNVAIYDHDHCFGIEGIHSGYKTAPVIIEKNCWIGAGVIILRGTHIGEGCVIGAGCVVKGNIPAHSLVTSDRTLTITPIEKHR